MTFPAISLLVALAMISTALKRPLTARVFFAISSALVLAIGCGPVPTWLLQDLHKTIAVKPDILWAGRNAIVLLGGGVEKHTLVEPGLYSYSRLVATAALYRQCRAAKAGCIIIISGGDPAHEGSSEAEVNRGVLLKLGIDAADIVLETKSRNTFQNAQFSTAMLAQRPVDNVFLVSSSIHLKRSELYFRHFGTAVTPVRSDYLSATLSLLPLAHNLSVTDFAIHEYIGIARYHVYNALGWNPSPSPRADVG
mgnify:CR=1 FL=1